MGSCLPDFSEPEFVEELSRAVRPAEGGSVNLSENLGCVLFRHYQELRRWNRRISLVGPGTASEVVRRHYGESLAALPLIAAGDRRLLDAGSGAGFPGLVLSAVRPDLDVTLVDSRERKWLFLKTAARRCRLSCRCLNARVQHPLPEELHLVTARAIALPRELFELFREHSSRARFLVWCGTDSPELPEALEVRREIPLAGSRRRRILEVCSVRGESVWPPSSH